MSSIERLFELSTGRTIAEFHRGAGYRYRLAKVDGKALLVLSRYHQEEYKIFDIQGGHLVRIGHYVNGTWAQLLPDKISQKLNCFLAPYDSFIANGEVIPYEKNSEHYITDFLADDDGTLWLGTERGLVRSVSDAVTCFSSAHLPEVWGVVQAENGTIWTPDPMPIGSDSLSHMA